MTWNVGTRIVSRSLRLDPLEVVMQSVSAASTLSEDAAVLSLRTELIFEEVIYIYMYCFEEI